jgi:hypothetical protein
MMFPKPTHKRAKKTAKQRGAISQKVRRELKERSDGICERCRSRVAVHAAHITRRWKLAETTVDDLLHLCLECHIWADGTEAGRKYLKEKENNVK